MSAASACRDEAADWGAVAATTEAMWAALPDDEVAPTEQAVIGHDPAEDLDRRARTWGHRPPSHLLPDLCRFAAALALAEADAWEQDQPHVATRAAEDRRFLFGDRILHWAVPWLDTAGRCYGEHRVAAHRARDTLLAQADRDRPAPALTGGEGLTPPGTDHYGPRTEPVPTSMWLGSQWSGALILRRTMLSMTRSPDVERALADPGYRGDLALLYEVTAARWTRMADEHPGSAALWRDLATRAAATSGMLGS